MDEGWSDTIQGEQNKRSVPMYPRDRMPQPEQDRPPQRVEEQVLRKLGFDQFLDAPVRDRSGGYAIDADNHPVTGRNFLDVYRDADRRQHTEDILRGFLELSAEHPDYPDSAALITSYVNAAFSPGNQ